MARLINRLSAKTVAALKEPGYYPDGAGLYLQVSKSGSKSWVFRFTKGKKTREMGLGSLQAVSLEKARAEAAEKRTQLAGGADPIDERRRLELEKAVQAAKRVTFDDCADRYIKAHRAGWRNAKHAQQWTNTLRTYVSPEFGKLPVQDVDEALILKVLEPLWTTKTETATRVRSRIEAVLDWATVRKYRLGENPARWRGHLDKLLMKPRKVTPVRHHPALAYVKAPEFLAELRERSGVSPKALEFVILTACRVGEAVAAQWPEFDLEARTWTVPATRMKSKREHRVPLSGAAVAILEVMKPLRQRGDYVFPGWRIGRHLTDAAVLKVLRDMGRDDLTTHGFRSTFRDWCSERTSYPREVAEAALAHVVGDKTEAAYRRGDLFEKRRRLMGEWARFLATPAVASVTPIRRKAK